MKLGEAKPQTRGEHSRLEDLVDTVKLPNNKWVQVRILDSDVLSYRQHWINILASKTKREVRIPKMCLAHNPDTEELDGECPYCEIESQGGVNYLMNVIVRSLQDDAPAKLRTTKAEQSSGFKDPNSESWTPVRVVRFTAGLMKKVQELKALNKHKTKDGVKTFDVNHAKFGVDLNIKYDENAKGPEKYQINLAEKSPLSEDELAYLQYELTPNLIKQLGLESLAEAKKELGRMQIVGAEEFDEDTPKAKKKSKADLDDDEDDDLGDDEDEPVSKKKPASKKPAAKSRKPVDDDEDDYDDEDDEPAPKKKPAVKSRKPVDDDEDDDFDDEDEDDEPAPKKKPASKKPAVKSRKPVDDDEDDDFDDEDEDEDDEPVSKKSAAKKPAPKKPAAKSKKPVDDEDDDFDDEDEDDEPAPKKKPASKKPAPKKPAAKSRKPVDDDEDDEDEDEDDFDDEDEDEDGSPF